MTDKPKTSDAEQLLEMAEATEERLTDLRLSHRLTEMKRRCRGVDAAVGYITVGNDQEGADESIGIRNGVAQLVTDVADEMERLAVIRG